MDVKTQNVSNSEEIRALNARISALEAENASLRDDVAELERELEYISRAKHSKRKRWDDDE